MRRTWKAALSLSAAAILLTGGAGTLAYWSSPELVGGAPVEGGHLALVTDSTNTGCADWQLRLPGGATTPLVSQRLVPGDVLQRRCAFTIDAEGANLKAALSISSPTFSGADGDFGGSLEARIGAVSVDGEPATTFTAADDGKPVAVNVQVVWDAADTGHMDARTALDDLTLSAQQVAP